MTKEYKMREKQGKQTFIYHWSDKSTTQLAIKMSQLSHPLYIVFCILDSFYEGVDHHLDC